MIITHGAVEEAPAPEASAWAEHLAAVFGPAVLAVLHYGSRAQGRPTGPDSAFDFFVIVSGYSEAYAAPSAAGVSIRARRANLLARLLPPNGLAVRRPGAAGPEAKCLILSLKHFVRECSPRARDHFVAARLIQRIVPVWFRHSGAAEAVDRGLRVARERTIRWVPVFLPVRFTLEDYCRTLIAVSYAHEVRAESPAHVENLLAAQWEVLHRIYRPLLDRFAEEGTLARDAGGYRQVRPVGRLSALRVRSYFQWSKARTTLRLLKHPFLYQDWLDYLLRKVERHTGVRIELTEKERRHPLIFLWPRALRYLRGRPQRVG
jgi:hypothetical protein